MTDATEQPPVWMSQERRVEPRVEDSIGLLLRQNEQMGIRIDEALATAKRAERVAGENADAHALLAQCYEQHIRDTQWIPAMRDDLNSIVESLRFVLTLQKVIIWFSKAAAGLLALIATVIGITDYLAPWIQSILHAHRGVNPP